MDNSFDEDSVEDEQHDYFINFPPEVQKAIEEVLPSKDPLDEYDFNSIDYINTLFPTEQSLSNIDEVVIKLEEQINHIDAETSDLIKGQINASTDGRNALDDAQKIITQLFVHVHEIKERAERSEEMVREITRDIKQLDCAKRNLTLAITTLNHLHMLVGGVDSLKLLTSKRAYGEIALPLQAIGEVMTHFEDYSDIVQIKHLSDQVKQIRNELAVQIDADFKQAFTSIGTKSPIPNKQLAQACLVVSVLDSKVKQNLLDWFIDLQLQEYKHLFDESEDNAWLDKIDKRYAWLKRHLLEFEERLGTQLFPNDWEVSERIAVQFCQHTRLELTKIMLKRRNEIDVKLLLFAIQKTTSFENLLNKRFACVTLDGATFDGIISLCFVPFLDIYVASIDRNLNELIDRFVQDEKSGRNIQDIQDATILSSCPDLFVFYKRSMIQCHQLDRGQSLLALTGVFKKYLHDYADKLLLAQLPKIDGQSLGNSVQSLTRDLPKLATSGIMQNFSSFLKEGDTCNRLRTDEIVKCCRLLTTAEYCLETTQQLSDKLKEKIDINLIDQIDFSKEQDDFHKVISNCIQLLVQDLENACESALNTMGKIQWQNIDAVGDQSGYVSEITTNLKNNVPIVRDHLSNSRKYFTQFCTRFVNAFVPKFVQNIYRCKPINTEGAEQLLLDTHMLKTVLLGLPSIASRIDRAAPSTYTKVVTKGMTKAEMILKLVMTPVDPAKAFVEQYRKLLPDCAINEFQKVLEMKNMKRQEQAILIDMFKAFK